MEVVTSRAELAAARSKLSGTVAVVMTMGALHAGHASLVRAARNAADHVIVTIFVNQLQFGAGEDFERYPRTLASDREICDAQGADLIFAPPSHVMYPAGQPLIRVDAGQLGDILEGRSRPGHFSGVLTIVLKLMLLIRPDIAVFGEKDYQQLALITAMVADLDVPTTVLGVQTVRESDGLALSSRNRYLSPEERRSAVALSRALFAGQAAAQSGEPPQAILRTALSTFTEFPAAELDYLAVTDRSFRVLAKAGAFPEVSIETPVVAVGDDPTPRSEMAAPANSAAVRMLVAARVGTTRLIDNVDLENP
jgi:pantoate--beta-alanine ligase